MALLASLLARLRTFLVINLALTTSVDMSYHPFVMIPVENKAKLAGFRADLTALEAKLAELDVQREDTRKQIEHLRRIVANLASL